MIRSSKAARGCYPLSSTRTRQVCRVYCLTGLLYTEGLDWRTRWLIEVLPCPRADTYAKCCGHSALTGRNLRIFWTFAKWFTSSDGASFLSAAGWVVRIFFRRCRPITKEVLVELLTEEEKQWIRSNNGGLQTLHARGSLQKNGLNTWIDYSMAGSQYNHKKKLHPLVQSYSCEWIQ